MRSIFTLILVAIVTVAGAGAHGYVTGRWQARGPDGTVELPSIPMNIGDWKGEDQKSGDGLESVLRNLTRKYTHAKSSRAFTVSLTVGPAGLTAQHTPEYCYPGSGYQPLGQTETLTAAGRTTDNGGFRTAVFRKPSLANGEALRILWAWTPDGKWSAPKVPELKFFHGTLYKLYIVSWAIDRPPEQDPELQDFLTQLLAAFDHALEQIPQ